MKKMNMKQIPLAGIMAVLLIVGAAGAAYITLFSITKTGSVSVIATSTVFQMYNTRISPGTYSSPVTTLTFPDVFEGSTMTSQGTVIYLYTPSLVGSEEIKFKWTSSGVPAGAVLTAQFSEDESGAAWAPLASGTLCSRAFMSDHKGQCIKFKLDMTGSAIGVYPGVNIVFEVMKGP